MNKCVKIYDEFVGQLFDAFQKHLAQQIKIFKSSKVLPKNYNPLPLKSTILIQFENKKLSDIARLICPVEIDKDLSWEVAAQNIIKETMFRMVMEAKTVEDLSFEKLKKLLVIKGGLKAELDFKTLESFMQPAGLFRFTHAALKSAPNTRASYFEVIRHKLENFSIYSA